MSSIGDKGQGPFSPLEKTTDAEEAGSRGESSPLGSADSKIQDIAADLSKLTYHELLQKHDSALEDYDFLLIKGDKTTEIAKAAGLITTIQNHILDRVEALKRKLETEPSARSKIVVYQDFDDYKRVNYKATKEPDYDLPLPKVPHTVLEAFEKEVNPDCHKHVEFLENVYMMALDMTHTLDDTSKEHVEREYFNSVADEFINQAIVLCKRVYRDDSFVEVVCDLLKLKDANLNKPRHPESKRILKPATVAPQIAPSQTSSHPIITAFEAIANPTEEEQLNFLQNARDIVEKYFPEPALVGFIARALELSRGEYIKDGSEMEEIVYDLIEVHDGMQKDESNVQAASSGATITSRPAKEMVLGLERLYSYEDLDRPDTVDKFMKDEITFDAGKNEIKKYIEELTNAIIDEIEKEENAIKPLAANARVYAKQTRERVGIPKRTVYITNFAKGDRDPYTLSQVETYLTDLKLFYSVPHLEAQVNYKNRSNVTDLPSLNRYIRYLIDEF